MVKLFVTDSVLSTQTLSVNMPKFVSFRLIARIKCGNRATPLVQVSDADRLSCSISKFMLAPSATVPSILSILSFHPIA